MFAGRLGSPRGASKSNTALTAPAAPAQGVGTDGIVNDHGANQHVMEQPSALVEQANEQNQRRQD
jgi:hypothetical protein